MQRVIKGDNVKILSGKDRGKNGKVLAYDPKESMVLLEGLNLKKKHVKSKRQDKKGEIIMVPAFFDAAKVMPVCPNCKKAARPNFSSEGDKKERVCNKCDKPF